jgi:hypothetical protein
VQPEKIKNSKNLKENERGVSDSKSQQLNFYQNSEEGSSDNLVEKSVDQDNMNDSGEIIYQQNKVVDEKDVEM